LSCPPGALSVLTEDRWYLRPRVRSGSLTSHLGLESPVQAVGTSYTVVRKIAVCTLAS